MDMQLQLQYAITTDIWSSQTQDSFMSVTLHYINKDLKRKIVVLRIMPYNTQHTADSIKKNISNILKDWELPAPIIFLRDSASNVTKALANSLPCLCHTLQLVIKHGILEEDDVCALCKKCKKVTKKLRSQKGRRLASFHTAKKFPLPNATR